MQNSQSTPKGHPKGLYVLFITEMWERFSYYGMRAIFSLYLAKALLFSKEATSSIYGSYTGLVYLTPLIGGYVADRYWGNRRSIMFGGLLMAIGQFLMFGSGSFYTNHELSTPLMFAGLGFLIVGNGFFKPNISTMVGQLYPPGDKRVDSAFTIFYMGINLGAFIAPLACGFVGDTGSPADFKWGFLLAGVGMVISLALFQGLKNKYIVSPDGSGVGLPPKRAPRGADFGNTQSPGSPSPGATKGSPMRHVIAAILFVGLGVLFTWQLGDLISGIIYSSLIAAPYWIIADATLTKTERKRIWVIFIIAFFVIFFWSAFEQAGASLTFFAEEQTNRNLFGYEVPASYFQAINAVAIVIFAPLFAFLWTSLGKKKMEPNSPLKQAIGLFLLSMGYLFIAYQVKDMDPATKSGIYVITTLYLLHTFGELCLSPIGLSMVVKLAPLRLASLLMGVWFLSTASANKFAGDLSKLYPAEVVMEVSDNASAPMLITAGDTLNPAGMKMDSTFWASNHKADSVALAAFTTTYKSETPDQLAKDASAMVWTVKVDSIAGKEGKKEAIVSSITQSPAPAALATSLPTYKFKQIIPSKPDGAFKSGLSADGKSLYVLKSRGVVETWNLNPEKPYFLGIQITNLYQFFMIFVIMAGIAAVILFFLSRILVRRSEGIL